MALVLRGSRLAVVRSERLPLRAFTLKDPLVFGEASFLAWTMFFFFGTDFLVDGFNSFIVQRSVGKCFLAIV